MDDPIGTRSVESEFPENELLNEAKFECCLFVECLVGLDGVECCFDSEIGLLRLMFAEFEEPDCLIAESCSASIIEFSFIS